MEGQQYTKWISPQIKVNSFRTGLKVNNSLAPGDLVEFVPFDGKTVKWYLCGPTVYDHSHLGHARTYIGQDILRKIMRDYFGYNLMVCMNITNIDDKIIKRSLEQNQNFDAFAEFWETEFFKDMKTLNIEIPDCLTRVSEYIEEIKVFITKILENGYGYVVNGSVYFDIKTFTEAKKFFYGIMSPSQIKNIELLKEAEGVLSGQDQDSEKKNQFDFALWKKSKEGEPKWSSPWGEGRPGWHIECSCMAAHVFEYPIDIHSGGVDLRFPHHTNELAQSEAYYNKPQWINYFLHTGHLNIDGLKMSKSLKNFISIKEILKKYSVNQLRLLFVMHQYDALMDFSETSFSQAIAKEKKIKDFFTNLNVFLRGNPLSNPQKFTKLEFQLQKQFEEHKLLIHKAFCNNFCTKGVLEEITKLMNETYIYAKESGAPKYTLINTINEYLLWIFEVLGLNYKSLQESLNETQMAFIEKIIKFRIAIRKNAKAKDLNEIDKELKAIEALLLTKGITITREAAQEKQQYKIEKTCELDDETKQFLTVLVNFMNEALTAIHTKNYIELLKASDQIRDDIMPLQGIKIEDNGTDKSIWKYEDKDIMLKEKQLLLEEKALKEEQKKQKEESKKNQKTEKTEIINPKEMFIKQIDKYSKFDENGIPTHDEKGEELAKKARNKLKKIYETQVKKFEKAKQQPKQ